MRLAVGAVLVSAVLGIAVSLQTTNSADFVPVPVIENNTISPRIVYIENPRFPNLSDDEVLQIIGKSADLVREHFGLTMKVPATIGRMHIDDVFLDLVGKAPKGLDEIVGDFRSDNVDWKRARQYLVRSIGTEGNLTDQIAFAEPHLIAPLRETDTEAFADAILETFRSRLAYWTDATLPDGYPIIGRVPGRADLPLNEYAYWTTMAKLGTPADIVLTNQLVASIEYMTMPVHTALRGGITGGGTDYNPGSQLGSSVWVSVAPMLMDDEQINRLRFGKSYDRVEALRYAAIMLAHEIGHMALHLGHPWSNSACVMRPAELLDFATWEKSLNASGCPIGSDPQMKIGAAKIPVW